MEVCSFMRFKRRNGTYTSWAAQNFFIDQVITHNGLQYPYLPIAVATNSSTRGGDRSEAALGAGISALSMNVFAEAAAEEWLLEVRSVKVNRATLQPGQLLVVEYWSSQQVQHSTNDAFVTLQLASPLDAVKAPGGRVLNQSLVGALPTSGTLTLQ